MKKRNEVVSIFGQIDEVVANQMLAEGKASLLAPTDMVSLSDIPNEVSQNERGEKVRMVIVLPPKALSELERRIADLRQ